MTQAGEPPPKRPRQGDERTPEDRAVTLLFLLIAYGPLIFAIIFGGQSL